MHITVLACLPVLQVGLETRDQCSLLGANLFRVGPVVQNYPEVNHNIIQSNCSNGSFHGMKE